MTVSAIEIDESRLRDHGLYEEEIRQNWEAYSSEWATSEPFFVLDRGLPHFVCGRYADVRKVFLAREDFTTVPPKKPGFERYDWDMGAPAISKVEGEAHDRLRRVIQPTFSQERADRLRKATEHGIDALLDAIDEKGEFDAYADFSSHLVPLVLMTELLGFDEEQRRPFIRRQEIAYLTMHIPPGGAYPQENVDVYADAKRVIAEVIENRRRHGLGDDFVGAMLRAQAEGMDISDEEIQANFFVLGGATGSVSIIGATMLMLLCQNRGELEKLQNNIDLVPDAVEECMRRHPPGIFNFPRFATRDVEIGGVRVPAGTPSFPSNTAANLDPAVFPEPLRLDIERRPAQTMVFGAGVHFCIGAVLSRMILQTALRRIVERFRNLDLVDPDFRPTYKGLLGELRPAAMPMRVR